MSNVVEYTNIYGYFNCASTSCTNELKSNLPSIKEIEEQLEND